MSEEKWERAAGIGGILFVVLVIVSVVLPGEPPATGDSAREIAKWFGDNGDEIRYASFIGLIATIPLVWWAASVFRMMGRATGNARLGVIAMVGLAIGAGASCVASVILAATAIDAAILGPGGLRFFYLLATNLNAAVAVGSVLLTGAIAAAVLRSGMLPKWVGWLGALVALLTVLATGVMASTRDAVMALSFIGLIAFTVYVLVISIFMLQGKATGEPVAAPAQ